MFRYIELTYYIYAQYKKGRKGYSDNSKRHGGTMLLDGVTGRNKDVREFQKNNKKNRNRILNKDRGNAYSLSIIFIINIIIIK